MSQKDQENNLITGLIIGGAIGTITGLLFAPRTGKETRGTVKKTLDALPQLSDDLLTTNQLRAKRWSKSMGGSLQKSLNRLHRAITAGIEASKLEDDPRPTSSENKS